RPLRSSLDLHVQGIPVGVFSSRSLVRAHQRGRGDLVSAAKPLSYTALQSRGRARPLPPLRSPAMQRLLSRAWWMLAIQGAAALLFGILALAWPGATILLLIGLFAAYAIIQGVIGIAGALQNRDEPGWWL